jgi:hypothetical protein
MEVACPPTGTSGAAVKPPSPLLSRTLTLWSKKFAVAKSDSPSPSKSATTSDGALPTGTSSAAVKLTAAKQSRPSSDSIAAAARVVRRRSSIATTPQREDPARKTKLAFLSLSPIRTGSARERPLRAINTTDAWQNPIPNG